MCFVVLLKSGYLSIVECLREAVFTAAQHNDAGICGTFENKAQAERFIAALRSAKELTPAPPRFSIAQPISRG
jgi:hypothetical protein